MTDDIEAAARALMQRQQSVFQTLRAEMEAESIVIRSRDALSDADRAYLADVFLAQVFPVLSPLAIDPAHPFPFIPNLGISILFELKRDADGEPVRELIMLPSAIKTAGDPYPVPE